LPKNKQDTSQNQKDSSQNQALSDTMKHFCLPYLFVLSPILKSIRTKASAVFKKSV
jgi:hypothetical protein